jgi:hypothetical protein
MGDHSQYSDEQLSNADDEKCQMCLYTIVSGLGLCGMQIEVVSYSLSFYQNRTARSPNKNDVI